MGIFGWSLPPGCSTLPDEENEPSEKDLACQRAGQRILKEFGAKNWAAVYRALYKATSCGVTIGVQFHGHDKPVYNYDLAYYGPNDWPLAVLVSSIVEGIDAVTDTITVSLGKPNAVKRVYEACDEIDRQAKDLWNETHGCNGCADEWAKENVYFDADDYVCVHPKCKICGGMGIVR